MARSGPSLDLLDRDSGIACRSVKEMSVLFAISQALGKSLDLGEIMRPVLRRMRDLLGMERAAITLINRDTGEFILSEAMGLSRRLPVKVYLSVISPQLRKTIEKGSPTIVGDLEEWARDRSLDADQVEKLDLVEGRSLVCVPLFSGGNAIGALSIEKQRDPRMGWESDLRVLSMIASLVGEAARVRQDAAEQLHSLRAENERLQAGIARNFKPDGMIGTSSDMRTVYYHIDQVAVGRTTVLIRGESGTGKELVAKAVHEKSDRAGRNFVKVNCAALPASIIESELFGHEKGAFTGALSMRKGRFEMADGGTLFLDEIGDIPPATQVKLLRVLQEREFERVGGTQTLSCDVRIIAATSRDLESMLEEGAFREDLYYRLNVFPIYIPALRERKCDLLLLADHFIEKYDKSDKSGRRLPTRISSAAIDLLLSYHWPGNVRELENCIERAVLLAKGQSIKAHHLPPTLQTKTAKERGTKATLAESLAALEREMIVDTLKETQSNMAEAARRLGLTERKMGLRVQKYGIDLERFRK
ncbi:MAG: sigma 54-interacting transcriptional regulator [Puniceicoccaceae bacterium]